MTVYKTKKGTFLSFTFCALYSKSVIDSFFSTDCWSLEGENVWILIGLLKNEDDLSRLHGSLYVLAYYWARSNSIDFFWLLFEMFLSR